MEMKFCGHLLTLLERIILIYTLLLLFSECSKLWLLMRRVLQRFLSCSRVKCFGRLGRVPSLIAYPFMRRSSNIHSKVRSMLPEFQDGDAQGLVAYLNVLQKVVENGNPTKRKKWFPDIEPLFKLLSYENVPPYLKKALQNAIAAFIWSYLEQYDLPVVVGPAGYSGQQISSQRKLGETEHALSDLEQRYRQANSTINENKHLISSFQKIRKSTCSACS